MFDVIEPSIVRAQFLAKRDVSFSSYIHQSQNHQNKLITPQTAHKRTEDSGQISIFDAAKYFSGVNDDQKDQNSKGLINNLALIPPRLSSVSSSIDDNGSNYGGQSSNCTSNNYRARSFHATPTASSEASWNSQSGLLANPPGSIGVTIPKNLSPNNSNSTTTTSNSTPRWPRISTKWFIPRRKCPCSGKESVQVEEREPRGNNLNFGLSAKNHHHSDSKVVGPLKSFTNNHSEMIGTTTATAAATATTTAAKSIATVVGGTTTTSTTGFTFPIFENPPIGVKKMFNVIADPPRDSLEVFQPKSHPSPKSRRTSYEDDNVLSDGSSDLFEIESFSTTYPCRDSMDDNDDEVVVHASSFNSSTMKRLGMVCRSMNNNNMNVDENDGMDEPMTPSVAPTECYAPSEVSVDWSVTTAEGFDRASLTNFSASASEIGMYAAMMRESERNNGGRGGGSGDSGGGGGGGDGGGEERKSKQGGGKGNNNSGGLLSCRCEKAVSVGPGPIKCSAEGGPPIASKHVSGRPAQQAHGVAAHANGRWK
ncbi:Protein PHYTOCHROME KINASE SUBSTRATE 4 [Bienertia sinuspersici]